MCEFVEKALYTTVHYNLSFKNRKTCEVSCGEAWTYTAHGAQNLSTEKYLPKITSNPIFWIRILLFPCKLNTLSKIFLRLYNSHKQLQSRKGKLYPQVIMWAITQKRGMYRNHIQMEDHHHHYLFRVANPATGCNEVIEFNTDTFSQFIPVT